MHPSIRFVSVKCRFDNSTAWRKSGSPKLATIGSGLTLALTAALLLAAAHPLHGQSETVLHSFGKGTDGNTPLAAPVLDTEGNLYGTTINGGTYTQGTVYKVTPSGTETILHSFDVNGHDGADPAGGLVRDTKGNLYGTAEGGGTDGCGAVFELTASGTETILYSFEVNGTDGCFPIAGLVRDTKGNLYGTTEFGGVNPCSAENCGTVFELTSSGRETILHNFENNGTDGNFPVSGLVRDTKGNLYGTTASGGTYDLGTVFELTPSGTETILHSFGQGKDGTNPRAGLILDTKGNLYGTTANGGTYNLGTVFELTLSRKEKVLHNFGKGKDGTNPLASLLFDTKGNLYGTTANGGAYNLGTVFELAPSGTETILYSFGGNPTDGYYPGAPLVFDTKGNLYGTTEVGGAYGYGTVFKVMR
jgi:uncharacterized repeat protein (TIGR03803 family)